MSYWTQQKKINSGDFDFMMEEYEGTNLSAWDFLHGLCAVFAYAYFKRYGGTIIKIRNLEWPNIHCYVKIEKGGEIYYVDIRGTVKTEEELLEEFELSYRDKDGFFDFYSDIWEDYTWEEYHTYKQIKSFYNRYVSQSAYALEDANKFLKTNREFYI